MVFCICSVTKDRRTKTFRNVCCEIRHIRGIIPPNNAIENRKENHDAFCRNRLVCHMPSFVCDDMEVVAAV